MRSRWRYVAALALAGATSGCAGVKVSADTTIHGDALTVYSSLPLEGPEAALGRQIEQGEKLALAEAGGRAGRFQISLFALDDASTAAGGWEPALAATNAKLAAQDNDAVAYIGDLDSGATAVSLPIVNGAGIAQVSPGSPYVGLTASLDAGAGDPARFYPTGRRTFVRLVPGDAVEARAQARLMRSLGVKRVYVMADADPFDDALARLTATAAAQAGVAIAGDERLAVAGATRPQDFEAQARRVAASGAQAVFYSGPAEAGAVALWRELHQVDPGLRLLGSQALAVPAFTSRLGTAAGATLLGTPWLAPALYPARAATVMRRYSSVFGEAAQVSSLYGYEAMSLVLHAIAAAARRPNLRAGVVEALLSTRARESVIGRYSVGPAGEATPARYGIDRVRAGAAVPYASFAFGPAAG